MKVTGIVRRVDDLGRIVIPKEICRTMGVTAGCPLEMYVDSTCNGLVLVPYRSEVSSTISGIAENLSTMGCDPREREIANELRNIAKKLEKIENGA